MFHKCSCRWTRIIQIKAENILKSDFRIDSCRIQQAWVEIYELWGSKQSPKRQTHKATIKQQNLTLKASKNCLQTNITFMHTIANGLLSGELHKNEKKKLPNNKDRPHGKHNIKIILFFFFGLAVRGRPGQLMRTSTRSMLPLKLPLGVYSVQIILYSI